MASCTAGVEGSSGTGAPGATTTAATTTTTIGSTEAVDAFRACLSENGVEIEDVPIDATGRPRLDLVMASLDFGDPEVAEAVSLCSEHLGTGALDLGGEDVLRKAILGHLQEFSRCMVDLGVAEFPEPVAGFVGVGSPFPVAEIPYSDPDFGDAVVACRAALLSALSGTDEGT